MGAVLRTTGGLLLIAYLLVQAAVAAPVYEDGQALDTQAIATDGCYYNFEHYEEGDRILTNEPCLNCTCANKMLMCYLRVCPFTRAIGQDCTIEKKPDQCCPVITCPQVPVALLTSSTTLAPSTTTALGRPDNYGCTLEDNIFYADGAQVPSDPRRPCELCYCIRNRTTCVMQECTLKVAGCTPVYQEGICCPVRYDCDYEEILTTPRPTQGQMTTPSVPLICHGINNTIYHDGELIDNYSEKPCERCYCMHGSILCAVRDCGSPMEGTDCKPIGPRTGECCPHSYECANGIIPADSLEPKPTLDGIDQAHDVESEENSSEESNNVPDKVIDSSASESVSSEENEKAPEQFNNKESVSKPSEEVGDLTTEHSTESESLSNENGDVKDNVNVETTSQQSVSEISSEGSVVLEEVTSESGAIVQENHEESVNDNVAVVEEVTGDHTAVQGEPDIDNSVHYDTPTTFYPDNVDITTGKPTASEHVEPTSTHISEENNSEHQEPSENGNHGEITSARPNEEIEMTTHKQYTEVSVENMEINTSPPEIAQQIPEEKPSESEKASEPSVPELVIDNTSEKPAFVSESPEVHEAAHQENHVPANDPLASNEIPEPTKVSEPNSDEQEPIESARIPGEGSCLIEGKTYAPNSEVPTSNACQKTCHCKNSVVHCVRVECPPPPSAAYANCVPIETPDSCCPTYMCDQKPSDAPEVQNQLSIDKIDTSIDENGNANVADHEGHVETTTPKFEELVTVPPGLEGIPPENLIPGVDENSSATSENHLNEEIPLVNGGETAFHGGSDASVEENKVNSIPQKNDLDSSSDANSNNNQEVSVEGGEKVADHSNANEQEIVPQNTGEGSGLETTERQEEIVSHESSSEKPNVIPEGEHSNTEGPSPAQPEHDGSTESAEENSEVNNEQFHTTLAPSKNVQVDDQTISPQSTNDGDSHSLEVNPDQTSESPQSGNEDTAHSLDVNHDHTSASPDSHSEDGSHSTESNPDLTTVSPQSSSEGDVHSLEDNPDHTTVSSQSNSEDVVHSSEGNPDTSTDTIHPDTSTDNLETINSNKVEDNHDETHTESILTPSHVLEQTTSFPHQESSSEGSNEENNVETSPGGLNDDISDSHSSQGNPDHSSESSQSGNENNLHSTEVNPDYTTVSPQSGSDDHLHSSDDNPNHSAEPKPEDDTSTESSDGNGSAIQESNETGEQHSGQYEGEISSTEKIKESEDTHVDESVAQSTENSIKIDNSEEPVSTHLPNLLEDEGEHVGIPEVSSQGIEEQSVTTSKPNHIEEAHIETNEHEGSNAHSQDQSQTDTEQVSVETSSEHYQNPEVVTLGGSEMEGSGMTEETGSQSPDSEGAHIEHHYVTYPPEGSSYDAFTVPDSNSIHLPGPEGITSEQPPNEHVELTSEGPSTITQEAEHDSTLGNQDNIVVPGENDVDATNHEEHQQIEEDNASTNGPIDKNVPSVSEGSNQDNEIQNEITNHEDIDQNSSANENNNNAVEEIGATTLLPESIETPVDKENEPIGTEIPTELISHGVTEKNAEAEGTDNVESGKHNPTVEEHEVTSGSVTEPSQFDSNEHSSTEVPSTEFLGNEINNNDHLSENKPTNIDSGDHTTELEQSPGINQTENPQGTNDPDHKDEHIEHSSQSTQTLQEDSEITETTPIPNSGTALDDSTSNEELNSETSATHHAEPGEIHPDTSADNLETINSNKDEDNHDESNTETILTPSHVLEQTTSFPHQESSSEGSNEENNVETSPSGLNEESPTEIPQVHPEQSNEGNLGITQTEKTTLEHDINSNETPNEVVSETQSTSSPLSNDDASQQASEEVVIPAVEHVNQETPVPPQTQEGGTTEQQVVVSESDISEVPTSINQDDKTIVTHIENTDIPIQPSIENQVLDTTEMPNVDNQIVDEITSHPGNVLPTDHQTEANLEMDKNLENQEGAVISSSNESPSQPEHLEPENPQVVPTAPHENVEEPNVSDQTEGEAVETNSEDQSNVDSETVQKLPVPEDGDSSGQLPTEQPVVHHVDGTEEQAGVPQEGIPQIPVEDGPGTSDSITETQPTETQATPIHSQESSEISTEHNSEVPIETGNSISDEAESTSSTKDSDSQPQILEETHLNVPTQIPTEGPSQTQTDLPLDSSQVPSDTVSEESTGIQSEVLEDAQPNIVATEEQQPTETPEVVQPEIMENHSEHSFQTETENPIVPQPEKPAEGLPIEAHSEVSTEPQTDVSTETSSEHPPVVVSVDQVPETQLTDNQASLEAESESQSEISSEASPILPVHVQTDIPEIQPELPVESQPDLTQPPKLQTEAPEETQPEASVETQPEASVETQPEASVETQPEASVETQPEASVETQPEASGETQPESPLDTHTEISVNSDSEASGQIHSEIPAVDQPESSSEIQPNLTEEEKPIETNSEVSTEAEPEVTTKIESEIPVDAQPEGTAVDQSEIPSETNPETPVEHQPPQVPVETQLPSETTSEVYTDHQTETHENPQQEVTVDDHTKAPAENVKGQNFETTTTDQPPINEHVSDPHQESEGKPVIVGEEQVTNVPEGETTQEVVLPTVHHDNKQPDSPISETEKEPNHPVDHNQDHSTSPPSEYPSSTETPLPVVEHSYPSHEAPRPSTDHPYVPHASHHPSTEHPHSSPHHGHQTQRPTGTRPEVPLFPNWSQKPFDHHTTAESPQHPEEPHYPSGFEQDYEDDDGASYGPGTCRYGGKVYLSAQQIPRDDPCDFCFCFRSDIICLQQSCPPPIKGCYQETIKGFCCPRYECHVSMATMMNITTTTTTTTTTLPPHFFAHAYRGAATREGCQVKGVAYSVGDRIPSTSGPCLECRCGANGQMKCDPTVCGPQEALLRQVMDAAAVSRRR